MKKLHKINLLVVWMCAVVLTVFLLFSQGWTASTMRNVICVAAVLTTSTVLYFFRANDSVKAIGITLISALGCLAASIIQGGSAEMFLLSFIALGMAIMYFDKKILFTFLAVYVPLSLIAGIINPSYVSGDGNNAVRCFEYLAVYSLTGILIMSAIPRSKPEAASVIPCEDSIINDETLKQSHISIAESSENMAGLVKQIEEVSQSVNAAEHMTESIGKSASGLSTLVSATIDALNQNTELNIGLDKKFTEVSCAVNNGNTGAKEVREILNELNETVIAAGESTQILLGKIGSVDGILKEINKISLRTGMLSINASIEAAKAGESGKGFAVVAEEIKGLADESSESSKKIQQIISELIHQVDDVAAKTSAGTKAATAGKESLEKLLMILESIKSAQDNVVSSVSAAAENNSVVNSKIDSMSSEISNMVSEVTEINGVVKSVSAILQKQNQ